MVDTEEQSGKKKAPKAVEVFAVQGFSLGFGRGNAAPGKTYTLPAKDAALLIGSKRAVSTANKEEVARAKKGLDAAEAAAKLRLKASA